MINMVLSHVGLEFHDSFTFHVHLLEKKKLRENVHDCCVWKVILSIIFNQASQVFFTAPCD